MREGYLDFDEYISLSSSTPHKLKIPCKWCICKGFPLLGARWDSVPVS